MNNKETEIKYLNQDEIRDFIIQKDYKIYKLQRIIDKAIEYIERLKNFKIKYAMLGKKELYASEKDFVKDLLDILRGKDNEI